MKKFTIKTSLLGISFALPMSLIACGDSNTTQINQIDLDMVGSIKDLPKCTSNNEGEQVFVKDEKAIRVCVDGKWYGVMGEPNGSDTVVVSKKDTLYLENEKYACVTESLKDSTGIKIICNGDSIGVVLNGADGKPGSNGKDGLDGTNSKDGVDGIDDKDGELGVSGSSCKLVSLDCLVHVVCGKDTVSLGIASNEDACQEVMVIDPEKIAVSLDTVTGASQKGPFLSGSKVMVKELSDGRSLTQTGNTFDGKILNDNGQFKITARMLVSQYVMLQADGYYRNEVTGENSESPLTLFALTDVNQRNIVNVNLLTHLEYDRVIYLVTQKKMTVKQAKKQAQKEILGILHIDNSDFSNSEDLNIAGSSDEDGALLAFSILFQGDRSVSQLTELLTRVSTDMETDGIWSDSTTRLKLADWAMDADTSDRLADIRGKVETWKLGSMVPKFEPYIRNFWVEELKLGTCDAAKVGAISFVANANSKYYAKTNTDTAKTKVRFICVENANGENSWRIASDFEKDIYKWKAGADGETMNGQVTGKVYIYDGLGKFTADHKAGWRTASKPESVYGGCTEISYEKIVKYTGADSSGYYQCQEKTRRWEQVSSAVVDIANLTEGDDGFAQWGSVNTDICYVYDTAPAYNGWRIGQNTDCTLGLNGCTKAVEAKGEMKYAKNGNYYMCKDNMWNLVSNDVQKNTYKLTCNADNDGSIIPGTADTWMYVCDANQWRKASQGEYESCLLKSQCDACTDSRQGKFSNDEELVCDSKIWRTPNVAELAKKSLCVDSLDGVILYDIETIGSITVDYVCNNGSWHQATPVDYTLEQWNIHLENHKPEVTFGTLTDSRDGRTYKTVTIGEQVWMAENLQYADSIMTLNLKGNSWCYNNDPKNCEIMGRLYTWTAAMDINETYRSTSVPAGMILSPHRGICPEGWHIPTSDEWDTMDLKSGGYAAQQSTGNPDWPNATNASGFTALPVGGYIDVAPNMFMKAGGAHFWSATEGANYAYYWYMLADEARLEFDDIYYGKKYGFSVRCLQDDMNLL